MSLIEDNQLTCNIERISFENICAIILQCLLTVISWVNKMNIQPIKNQISDPTEEVTHNQEKYVYYFLPTATSRIR